MGNFKRDMILLIIILITMLHGCLYSNNFDSYQNDLSVPTIYSEEYIINNIEEIFNSLNKRNISQAEKLITVFNNISLTPEIELLVNLAEGIIALENKQYDKACSSFEKAYPLKEAIIGLIYCNLEHGRIDNFNVVEELMLKIDPHYNSNIYNYFSKDFIKTLYLYHEFWTNYKQTTHEELMSVYFNNNTGRYNYLIDNIISNIISASEKMTSEIKTAD